MIDTNLAGDATTAADADFPPFPVWTPPESTNLQLSQAAAEELGRTIQSVATAQAQMDARLLELIGEFDAGGGTAHYDSIRSTTHWLAWACSMAPGTAREHVRVARALRTLPRTRQLLADGRLTYSKVRELTRIADLVDEDALCALALEMTASQLARTVRAYRAAPGQRIGQQSRRALSWHEADDGTIRLSVRLPADEAATIRAALDAAAPTRPPTRPPLTWSKRWSTWRRATSPRPRPSWPTTSIWLSSTCPPTNSPLQTFPRERRHRPRPTADAASSKTPARAAPRSNPPLPPVSPAPAVSSVP